ncbi:MAG: hypothetical protein H6Q49_220, partial [Deltaproteobacteria bacterium]|nr:hypothetical protein [Deltaproteobacteria bacterium]
MKLSTRSAHFSLLLSLLIVLVSVCVAFASGGEGGHESAGQLKSFAFKTLNAVVIIAFLV